MHRLTLTPAQRDDLMALRDTGAKPYLRERAAALLKVADGQVAAQIARAGPLRPRQPDTIYRWLARYRAEGIAGLHERPGRGRTPAFPPSAPGCRDRPGGGAGHRPPRPRQFGLAQTRWTLAAVGQICPWLAGYSRSGIGRVLDALDIVLKRGREHVHSPDPADDAKRTAIAESLAAARASEGRRVALFLDEVTLHRQPSLAAAYEARGRAQPRAGRSWRTDATSRVIGALDAGTGRVVWRRRRTLDVPALVGFYRAVVAASPQTTQIDLVLDTWPVHFHPDLRCALQPQDTPFPFPRPGNWPTDPSPDAERKWGALALPIQLVPLPTYASWLNPIEKLWRWLRQAVVHLHPWADDLPTLYAAVERFLDRFPARAPACHDLLRYVGLEIHD